MSYFGPDEARLMESFDGRMGQILMDFTQAQKNELGGPQFEGALAALDADWENIQGHLDHCLRHLVRPQDFAQALEIYLNLEAYFEFRNLWMQARGWGDGLRDWQLSFGDQIDVRLLNAVANAHVQLKDYEPAIADYWRIIGAIQQEPSRQGTLARIYNNLGVTHWRLGKLAEATVFIEQAIQLEAEHGRPAAVANLKMNLAQLLNQQGRADEALILSADTLSGLRENGEPLQIIQFSYVHGTLLSGQGRYAEAEGAYQQALGGYISIGDTLNVAVVQYAYALLCYRGERWELALELAQAAEAGFLHHGHSDLPKVQALLQRLRLIQASLATMNSRPKP
jgi:tetratricopeptide (TPR) repeat protein